jgi:recombination protein RecT
MEKIAMPNNEKETHVVSTPNKPSAQVTPVDQLKKELARDYQKQVENYFRGDKQKAMKFMSAAVYSVQKTPGLLECDRQTLFIALMTCAELELFPSDASGEAYIIPYKGKAQFQLGYQGSITLLYRSGVEAVNTQLICKNDTFEYEEGLEPKLIHKPAVFEKDGRGEPIGVYAIAVVNGQKLYKVMSAAEVLKFKEFSKAKGSEFSPWNSSNDPEKWMWRKTAIKQLAKVLPKNDALQRAFSEDNKDSVVSDVPQLDAAGPAVAKALHEPEA